MSTDTGLFSAEQVCKLAAITERQLRHWARDFYRPEHLLEDGGPFSHIYSFRDVVSLRTIGALRNKHRIPLPALRAAGAWLSERHDWPWSSLRFRVSGQGLYYLDPDSGQHVALTGPACHSGRAQAGHDRVPGTKGS
jgi:DNA-binding transcriptional MerR regulator